MNVSKPKRLTVSAILKQTVQQGECRLWVGLTHKNGGPIVYDGMFRAKKQAAGKSCNGYRSARVALLEITHGPQPPRPRIVMTCGHSQCVERKHMQIVSHAEFVLHQVKLGKFDTIRRRVACAATGRASSPITQAQADIIRERLRGGATLREAVRDMPVSTSTARAIGLNLRWVRKVAPNASIFALAQEAA